MLRNFVPEPPFSVAEFSGMPIGKPGRGVRTVTDWHVVDARGRTMDVVPYRLGGEKRSRRLVQAHRIAGELNRTAQHEART